MSSESSIGKVVSACRALYQLQLVKESEVSPPVDMCTNDFLPLWSLCSVQLQFSMALLVHLTYTLNFYQVP